MRAENARTAAAALSARRSSAPVAGLALTDDHRPIARTRFNIVSVGIQMKFHFPSRFAHRAHPDKRRLRQIFEIQPSKYSD
jgi:hypothetical protein